MPIANSQLYEPLCEVVWRTVGHVFYNILELQESNKLPVPQLAKGQIKMLIQSNEELTRQLNKCRSDHLKELVMLRDRTRKISQSTQNAVDSLQEEPIMFYEPLSYVLDQTTKDFVKEVVEERLKLEMRRADASGDKQSAQAAAEQAKEEAEQKLASAQAESKNLREAAKREGERAR